MTMRIAFIAPAMGGRRARDAMQPLVFSLLAARTPGDHALELWDERLAPIPRGRPVDLAAITVETYTARRAYQIAFRLRRQGVRVVMGGHHPTVLPEEALDHCDAVVMGDGEAVWPQLLEDAARGRLQPRYAGGSAHAMAGLESAPGLFAGQRYAPFHLIQFGRGCRMSCDFCSIRAFYGDSLRWRPIPEVIAELQAMPRRRVIFVDDNLFVEPEAFEALLHALIPLKLSWSCQISLDAARHPRLLALMRQSGCTAALLGIESLHRDNLALMNKNWAWRTGEGAPESLRCFREAGIMIFGTFVFGYDHDTPDSFDAAAEFAIEQKFFLAHFNPLTPMPGTPLYHRLAGEGRLLRPRWWLDPDYRYGQAVFRPLGMTPEELASGCYRARTRFNTLGSIARRLLDGQSNAASWPRAGLHLLANLVSRREVHAKQGRPLGLPDEPIAVERRP